MHANTFFLYAGSMKFHAKQCKLDHKLKSHACLELKCYGYVATQVVDIPFCYYTKLHYRKNAFLFSDSCTFKMEKEHLKVSELFPLINSEKVRLGILDWGVKMSTLEDGQFLSIDDLTP